LKNKPPPLKAQSLSLHSINSSKIPTMLENSIKPSLGDGQKREDERRKRKVKRQVRIRAYFCLAHAFSILKEKRAC
jgi:hypothetical protein